MLLKISLIQQFIVFVVLWGYNLYLWHHVTFKVSQVYKSLHVNGTNFTVSFIFTELITCELIINIFFDSTFHEVNVL